MIMPSGFVQLSGEDWISLLVIVFMIEAEPKSI